MYVAIGYSVILHVSYIIYNIVLLCMLAIVFVWSVFFVMPLQRAGCLFPDTQRRGVLVLIIKAHANVASLFLFVVLCMTVFYLLYRNGPFDTQCGSLYLLTCVTAVHNACTASV